MESISTLRRKRKLSSRDRDVVVVETHLNKQQKKVVEEKSAITRDEARRLHSKSVLQIENGKQTSFLLFLVEQQTVAIQGNVHMESLKGTVDISGFKFKPNSQPIKVYSPSSQSLLTVRECSFEHDKDSSLESGIKLRDTLSTFSAKINKIALARAQKASNVLLINGLDSFETNFICQHKEYENIFTKEYQEEGLSSSEKLYHDLTSPYGFTLLEGNDRHSIYTQPQEWTDILADFSQEITKTRNGSESPAMLICGGKGVGKSTFARTVINNLLNSCGEVCYLECDVGQTELTPPGILSLNCVSSPLLGPPFTHLQWPDRAYFYGDVSPKDNPDLYVNSISSLYEYYKRKFHSKPLVINTQGWVKGFGIPLLMDVIRITHPTHIVQINSNQASKNLPTITREFLDMSPGWVWPIGGHKLKGNIGDLMDHFRQKDEPKKVDPSDDRHKSYPATYQIKTAYTEDDKSSGSTLRPADHRTMAILAYFSNTLQSFQVNSLLHCRPYKVPWSTVAVHVVHKKVPRSQLLVSLNASVVGLAICPPAVLDEHGACESGLPKFLHKTPIIECIGLGILRNIDPINQFFYIVTPVPLMQLQQVNTLLKGSLEIPAPLLLKIGHPGAPYISSEFSYDIKGAGARKVRYNLQRKKFNSPAAPDV